MLKIYSIMAAAALIAGALVVAPSLGPVSASTRGDLTQTYNGKGDRLDTEARLACKQQSWGSLRKHSRLSARREQHQLPVLGDIAVVRLPTQARVQSQTTRDTEVVMDKQRRKVLPQARCQAGDLAIRIEPAQQEIRGRVARCGAGDFRRRIHPAAS